jgi:hypothetical protein
MSLKEKKLKIQLKRKKAIRIIQDYQLLHLSFEERGNLLLGYGKDVVNENNDEWIVDKVLKVKYNKIVRENYNYSKLITNNYLELKIKEFYGIEIFIIPDIKNTFDDYHSCVCCNYIISKKRRIHSICPVCSWQDDLTNEDKYSSPNRSSLKDYISNFIKEKELNPFDEKYIQYYQQVK